MGGHSVIVLLKYGKIIRAPCNLHTLEDLNIKILTTDYYSALLTFETASVKVLPDFPTFRTVL